MNTDWMERAACHGMEVEFFYSPIAYEKRAAKRFCEVCPVKQECLDFAVAQRDEHGVWGGTTPTEREYQGMPLASRADWAFRLRGCGTAAGLLVHTQINTPPCAACLRYQQRLRRVS